MATFKQRALTIATVGLLSGSPITIATNGLIQQAETPTPIPPVVEQVRRPAAGGITYLEYGPQTKKHLYAEFKWALNFGSDVSHKPVDLSHAKHDSSLFYALDIDVQPFVYHKEHSVFWYGLDTGFDVHTDSLPVSGYNGFSYALDISANVTQETPAQALWFSDTRLYADIENTVRYIPVKSDQLVYLNIHFSEVGFAVTSQHRFIDSGLQTYQQVSDNTVALDVSATHQSFTLFNSRYTESSELFTGFDYKSYSYVEHAPIELLSEEEELFLMLVHILAEDDDA